MMRPTHALITLGPTPSLDVSFMSTITSLRPILQCYDLVAVTKLLLSCFRSLHLYKPRSGENLYQVQQLTSDLGRMIDDVVCIARENLQDDDYFRLWCSKEGEHWDSAVVEFRDLLQTLTSNAAKTFVKQKIGRAHV